MLPVLFRIPLPFNVPFLGHEIVIFGYGLMLVIGFLLAVELAKRLARKSALDPELFVNAALIALVAGVIGARLSHVIENWPEFSRPDLGAWENFQNMTNIRSGGLTFYGGLILAFPIVILYGIYKKVPIRRGMDIIAPALMVGLAFGRIGCFLNGCCYGAEANVPWKVEFPYYSNAYIDQYDRGEVNPPAALRVETARGERLLKPEEIKPGSAAAAAAKLEHSRPLHPAQLYSTFNSLLVAAVLVAFFSLTPSPGRVMALMLMLEGATRYLLELVRAEPPVAHIGSYGLSLSMILGMLLVVVGAAMWLAFGEPIHQRGSPGALSPA